MPARVPSQTVVTEGGVVSSHLTVWRLRGVVHWVPQWVLRASESTFVPLFELTDTHWVGFLHSPYWNDAKIPIMRFIELWLSCVKEASFGLTLPLSKDLP